MAAHVFPALIFKTQKTMDDYGAPDMRYGDLSERYEKFGYKPFMTNMEATIEITGGRNEI
ncbi:DUF3289 family protein [Enterobacter asburiae]|nr:DUF3289 family protein [Enterobacter asburiae]